jgi:signal transduction histidine kinase
MRTADAYPFRLTTPLRFAVAVGAVAVVFAIDRLFDSLIDEGSLFLLLGTAVMASAWFAGTGPAVGATIAGALLAARWSSTAPATEARLALFVLQGLVLTAILSELRRARRVADQRAHEADELRRTSEVASRMKDEFLGTVSHELRTPLNAVLGWLHLLRTGQLDSDAMARGLESIERNARLQAQLTGNLLDVSKALTGDLRVECHPVSLTDVVRQVSGAALSGAHAKAVDLEIDLPDRPVALLGDWGRLHQVVWQLLANALKFAPRGGTIRVAVRTVGDQALLTVTDNGPGIDPSFLPKVFDPFTQADGSATRVAGGLGVGLSLVRDLVELHGGEITAGNRANVRGAEFTVRFPLQSEESLNPARQPPAPAMLVSSPPLDGLRVLVLDQSRESRELVEAVLHLRGAVVRSTGSVADALEALESWRPDVLVSDAVSSERDCYVVVGKVRSLEADRGGRIPALALTSLSQTDEHARDLLSAASRDVPKPIEPALLTAEVARLGGRERRRVSR